MNKFTMHEANTELGYITLRARLCIRDFFIDNASREVYENIGQVLSGLKMQLAAKGVNPQKTNPKDSGSPEKLLGKSIRDLRSVIKNLNPDTAILKDKGFADTLRETVTILFRRENVAIQTSDIKKIPSQKKLIVFSIILDLLVKIKVLDANLISITTSCSKSLVTIELIYGGQLITFGDPSPGNLIDDEKMMLRTVALIDGEIEATWPGDGTSHLKIILTIKR